MSIKRRRALVWIGTLLLLAALIVAAIAFKRQLEYRSGADYYDSLRSVGRTG